MQGIPGTFICTEDEAADIKSHVIAWNNHEEYRNETCNNFSMRCAGNLEV